LSRLKILETPARIICYPKPSEDERLKRIREMQNLGVYALLTEGETIIDGHRILGKGCVSLAVLAECDAGRVVLKIRRVDANREDMSHEVEVLRLVNRFGVGPRLLGHSTNLLLLQYIDGPLISDWLSRVQQGDLVRFKDTLRMLLAQCYRLDLIHVDHGELSDASKHVVVRQPDWHPFIVDFESASKKRRVKNLTSICQFLFMTTGNSPLSSWKRAIDGEDLKAKLREYKLGPNKKRFKQVLGTCNLIA
jgi:putative serine/threonine protein kinase